MGNASPGQPPSQVVVVVAVAGCELITDEHPGDPMNDHGLYTEGFSIFAIDADWPDSRQVRGRS